MKGYKAEVGIMAVIVVVLATLIVVIINDRADANQPAQCAGNYWVLHPDDTISTNVEEGAALILDRSSRSRLWYGSVYPIKKLTYGDFVRRSKPARLHPDVISVWPDSFDQRTEDLVLCLQAYG